MNGITSEDDGHEPPAEAGLCAVNRHLSAHLKWVSAIVLAVT